MYIYIYIYIFIIHLDPSFQGFGRNRTGDLRITHISVMCRAPMHSAKETEESRSLGPFVIPSKFVVCA